LSDSEEETTEIDNIIQSIILQNDAAYQLSEEIKNEISAHKRAITQTVVDFIQTVSDRQSVIEAKKQIGDKEGVEREIDQLSTRLTQLTQEYSVTEDEVKTYQTALEQVQQLANDIKTLNREKYALAEIDAILEKKDLTQKGISKLAEPLADAAERVRTASDMLWLEERKLIIEQVDSQIEQASNDQSNYQAKIETLKPKMDGSEQLSKTSAAIVEEKEKLNRLLALDVKLDEMQKTYDRQMDLLTSSFVAYRELYMKYADGINEKFSVLAEDLTARVDRKFRIEHFKEKLLEIFNNRTMGKFQNITLQTPTEEDFLDTTKLRAFIEAIIDGALQLKGTYTPETALRDIFADWNNIDYIISMDEDGIEDMSPGKKALVLLRLLISLAESKCPILIDQPEDDLDNRSIFEELIQFIKTKKVDRQIIIATHNANIVLGGDAELVIVANQRGKNSPNKAHRFEYRGGSIENNSFVTDEDGNIQEGILNQKGIQTHICEILEGGERAFDLRRNKYRFIR